MGRWVRNQEVVLGQEASDYRYETRPPGVLCVRGNGVRLRNQGNKPLVAAAGRGCEGSSQGFTIFADQRHRVSDA
jgi:hypothetical protein